MPLVDSTTRRPERSRSMPAGPRCDDPLHQGGPQVRLGRGRGTLGGAFSEPGHQRATEDDQEQEHHQRADVRQAPMVDDDIGDRVGDQPGLGQHQGGGHATENDGQHQVAASPPCVVQEAGVDGTGPPPRRTGRRLRHPVRGCRRRPLGDRHVAAGSSRQQAEVPPPAPSALEGSRAHRHEVDRGELILPLAAADGDVSGIAHVAKHSCLPNRTWMCRSRALLAYWRTMATLSLSSGEIRWDWSSVP